MKKAFEQYIDPVDDESDEDAQGDDDDDLIMLGGLALPKKKANDDGYDAALTVEERYEDEVESVQHDLAGQISRDNVHVEVGNICGDWDLYSPAYLDLHDFGSRRLRDSGQLDVDFHDYQRAGKLVVSREQATGFSRS